MLLTFPSPSSPELLLFVETRMAPPGTERHTRILEGCAKSAAATENPLIPIHPSEWVGIKVTGLKLIFLPSLSTSDFSEQGNSQSKARGFQCSGCNGAEEVQAQHISSPGFL